MSMLQTISEIVLMHSENENSIDFMALTWRMIMISGHCGNPASQ